MVIWPGINTLAYLPEPSQRGYLMNRLAATNIRTSVTILTRDKRSSLFCRGCTTHLPWTNGLAYFPECRRGRKKKFFFFQKCRPVQNGIDGACVRHPRAGTIKPFAIVTSYCVIRTLRNP